jgi:hypothetical protein
MVDFNPISQVNAQYTTGPARPAGEKKAPSEPSAAAVNDGFSKGSSSNEVSKAILSQLCGTDDTREADASKILSKPTRILSDNYGRVTHLAFQISDYVGGSMRNEVINAYKTVFQNMEPDTKFTIIVESDRDKSDVEKMIKSNNIPNQERFQFIKPGNLDLTVWARDQMIGMYFPDDPSKTALLNQRTLHSWHNDDEQVPPYVAAQNPSIVLDPEKRIRTDGGEVVSNNHETFVGFFSIAATAEKLQQMGVEDPSFRSAVISHYNTKSGQHVVESKDQNPFPFMLVPKEVPEDMHERDFKIAPNPEYKAQALRSNEMAEGDMWMKAAKDLFEKQFGQKVMVMGADDPSTPQVEGPANDHLDMAITPFDEKTVAVGDPSMVKRALEKMTPKRRKEVEKQLSELLERPVSLRGLTENRERSDYPNQQQDFDKYASNMEKEGYRVLRVPYSEPTWGTPNITYSNNLIERFTKEDGTHVKRVFLPVYGIKELDKIALDTYKGEGFEVFPIPLASLASRKGALRCISQWLARKGTP